jgi:hypothetical protein
MCLREGALSRSRSSSFDQRRRPERFLTAIGTAFVWPTRATSRLPLVMPVYNAQNCGFGVFGRHEVEVAVAGRRA